MTEDTGFEPAAEEPDESQAGVPEPDESQAATPVPAEDADPQEVAESAAAAEPEVAAEPGPADHVPPPWLPDEGVADWLRDAIHELHRRIQALGG